MRKYLDITQIDTIQKAEGEEVYSTSILVPRWFKIDGGIYLLSSIAKYSTFRIQLWKVENFRTRWHFICQNQKKSFETELFSQCRARKWYV